MDLNERIKNLFLNMINCPEKIVNVESNRIVFDNNLFIEYWNVSDRRDKNRDNIPLKIDSHDFSFHWDLYVKSENHLVFTIKTSYRQYQVPDFTDRLEYAKVLNILDKDLALFEQKKLEEYELHFTNRVQKSDDQLFYIPSSSETEEPF